MIFLYVGKNRKCDFIFDVLDNCFVNLFGLEIVFWEFMKMVIGLVEMILRLVIFFLVIICSDLKGISLVRDDGIFSLVILFCSVIFVFWLVVRIIIVLFWKSLLMMYFFFKLFVGNMVNMVVFCIVK